MAHLRVFVGACVLLAVLGIAVSVPLGSSPVLAAAEKTNLLDLNTATPEQLKALLRPYSSEELTAYPVSALVNNPRHDDPQCLEPVSVYGVHYRPAWLEVFQ